MLKKSREKSWANGSAPTASYKVDATDYYVEGTKKTR